MRYAVCGVGSASTSVCAACCVLHAVFWVLIQCLVHDVRPWLAAAGDVRNPQAELLSIYSHTRALDALDALDARGSQVRDSGGAWYVLSS